MLLVQWVVHIKVSHVVVPLWIMRVQEQSIYWELWANSLADIEQVEHLLDGLIALLTHASVVKKSYVIVFNGNLVLTCALEGCPRRGLVEPRL